MVYSIFQVLCVLNSVYPSLSKYELKQGFSLRTQYPQNQNERVLSTILDPLCPQFGTWTLTLRMSIFGPIWDSAPDLLLRTTQIWCLHHYSGVYRGSHEYGVPRRSNNVSNMVSKMEHPWKPHIWSYLVIFGTSYSGRFRPETSCLIYAQSRFGRRQNEGLFNRGRPKEDKLVKCAYLVSMAR